MRYLNMKIVRLFAICLLLAPFGAQAQDNFHAVGKITELNDKFIYLGDDHMRLSPTVKVLFPGNKRRQLDDLKPGYVVGVKRIRYQGKRYVDTIYYLPGGDPRSKGEEQ